jgi:hypothetical protein
MRMKLSSGREGGREGWVQGQEVKEDGGEEEVEEDVNDFEAKVVVRRLGTLAPSAQSAQHVDRPVTMMVIIR